MKNSEKLQENLNCIDENLNVQAIEGVTNSIKCFEKIENCGDIYSKKLTELKNSGKTIVIVSHNLDSVKQLCDRGIWIYDGMVRMDGEIDKVVDEYLKVCG